MVKKLIARVAWRVVDWADPADIVIGTGPDPTEHGERGESWTDGAGKVLRVHERNEECEFGGEDSGKL